LHITVFDFYEMTPVEFYYAIQEAKEMQKVSLQSQYELQRHFIRHHWNMQGRTTGKRGLKSDKEVEVFPWERGTERAPQTLEEQKL